MLNEGVGCGIEIECGPVAQLGERRVRNAKVVGSIPIGSTMLNVRSMVNYLFTILFATSSVFSQEKEVYSKDVVDIQIYILENAKDVKARQQAIESLMQMKDARIFPAFLKASIVQFHLMACEILISIRVFMRR